MFCSCRYMYNTKQSIHTHSPVPSINAVTFILISFSHFRTIEKILLSLNQKELATVKKQSFYKGPPADRAAGGRSFSTSSQSPSQFDYHFDENGVPLAPVGPYIISIYVTVVI